MDALPLEIIIEIARFLIFEVREYCIYDDASKSMRLCCSEFHKTFRQAFPYTTLTNTTCMSVADMCCPHRDPTDPFDRPLYRCAPYLWVEDWSSADRRCAMHTRKDRALYWCAGTCELYRVRLIWDDCSHQLRQISPPDKAVEMIFFARRLIKDMHLKTRKPVKPGSRLSISFHDNASDFDDFQYCMKRWGFKTSKMHIRCHQPNVSPLIVQWFSV